MPDFTVRSDSIDVEQIMEQIRARILEKRGADYTEEQIRELAAVKLEKFLDPRGVRSGLLDEFRQQQRQRPAPPNFAFEDTTLYESHRAPLRWIRKLLHPILKLFFNPNPLIQALHIQSKVNTFHAERLALDQLYFEVLHNVVVETTRLGIELKNLKMRVESLTSRLEFNERRARALESVVVYKPADTDLVGEAERAAPESPDRPPNGEAQPGTESLGPGQRSRRRRRRRGRRGGTPTASIMGAGSPPPDAAQETGDAGQDGGDTLAGHDDGDREP